jgi:subtilase family serine protease
MRWVAKVAGLVCVAALIGAGCGNDGTDIAEEDVSNQPVRDAPVPAASSAQDPAAVAAAVKLPEGDSEQIVFYYALPVDEDRLFEVAKEVSTPGTKGYRHFLEYEDAARAYGATPADIQTALDDVAAKGMDATVDPSRVFMRISGTAAEWEKMLGKPLKFKAGSADAPFDFYDFDDTPSFGSKLKFVGTGATVYDVTADGGRSEGSSSADAAGASTEAAWPENEGGEYGEASCATEDFVKNNVYTPTQISDVYGTADMRKGVDTTDVRVAVVDLGGGFSTDDLAEAASCFGYAPPNIELQHGDGVGQDIVNNNDETQLDIQTMAAVVPGATIEVVQATNGSSSVLDAVSRTFGDPSGPPEAGSISYGQCAVNEATVPDLVASIMRVLALGAITGSSMFVSAGDAGSTTCGTSKKGPSSSFAASSPWVTAVGGTRLELAEGNARAGEVAWNDSSFGTQAASGGGLSEVFDSPWYQQDLDLHQQFGNHRALPDLSALAAITPGWPVVLDGNLQSIGGTSGSSPFIAANIGLLAQRERDAGRPPLGLINPWLYQTYAAHPDAFHDVETGTNDLEGVGCCTAAKGYDLVTGLGVPDWAKLEAHVAPPGS